MKTNKSGIIIPVVVGVVLFAGVAFVYAAERPSRSLTDRPERPPRMVDERIPGQYIVVFNDSVSDVESAENEILKRVRGERLASYRTAIRGFAAQFSESELAAVEDDPRVDFVSEDRVVSIAAQQIPTGIDRVDAEIEPSSGNGIHVAVIDTGIHLSHPDLAGNIVGGRRCVRASGGYSDQNGHGTHVAGTIAALNNTAGVIGVAPEVSLWSVRVLDRNGRGSWSSVICGIDFVTSKAPANGGQIQVANMSLGGGGSSDNNCGNSNNDALHKAICRARDAGVTIVVAAGNSGADARNYVPASYDDAVITVSALADSDGKPGGLGSSTSYGRDDTFASFSNWGSPVDTGAPGVSIYSTWLSNGYNSISGTSMAAPHVAGAAALYLAANPNALWTEVRDAIIATGEKLGEGHTDPSFRHPENVLQIDSLATLWESGGGAPPPPEEDSPTEEPPAEDPPTEPEPEPTPVEDYFESFEDGFGNWTNDSQGDWRVRRQRATDGRYSIEVDGRATDAAIMSSVIDLGGAADATVSFDWYIERRVDSGEYIAFDVSKDGGSSWQEMEILKGNIDAEETWHSESIPVTGISSLKLRFRGTMDRSSEDANVDNIKVTI